MVGQVTLPDGWDEGLNYETRQRILAFEALADRGLFVFGRDHPKGYARIKIPPHHPYAYRRSDCGNTHPYQFLHRYLGMRKEGRVLGPWEHVHHVNGDKQTTDPEELQVLEAQPHAMGHYYGRFYYGERVGCGGHIVECEVCDGRGCFDCDHGMKPYD